MIKRQVNKTSYLIFGYLVTIKNGHNTAAGAPTFEANITNIKTAGACGVNTYCYRFKGHNNTEQSEAAYILYNHCASVINDTKTATSIKLHFTI